MRTCVGCRRTAAPAQLVRLSLDDDGHVVAGRRGGRGAWLCRDSPGCVQAALRRGAIGRALRSTLGEDDLRRVHMVAAPPGREGGAGPSVCEDGEPGRRLARRPTEQGKQGIQ